MKQDKRFESFSDKEISGLLDTIDMAENEGSSIFLELEFMKAVYSEVYKVRNLKHERVLDLYGNTVDWVNIK